jgi:enterochelin esterase-like enzyme
MKGARSAGRSCALAALALALPWLLPASPALSQEGSDGEPVSIGTYRQLHSEVLDEERTLLVSTPEGYEDGSISYPVLFVLYGGQIRGYLAEAVHSAHVLSEQGSIPQMIVVGVANVDRYRDLSPVARGETPSGIGPFSRFVAEELIPFVDSRYRTKSYRVLVGPQAGAEFALWTLAKRPGLFNAFIIENPFRFESVKDTLMPIMEKLMDAGLPSYTFLQVTCADRAGEVDKSREVEYMRAFERLAREKSPANLELVTHYVENSEDFLPPLRMKEGLAELFREYKFPEDREVRGLGDIRSHYTALSKRWGFKVDVPELTLYFKADGLINSGAADSALVILDYLIGEYPKSANGYWALANLHRERGDRELAIRYYRKCLEIIPNMTPARRWLEQLEAEE